MARETGIYRRPDSKFWWIATTLPNGKRLRQSAGTEDREDAEALQQQDGALISIAHRPAVAAFHNRQWTLVPGDGAAGSPRYRVASA